MAKEKTSWTEVIKVIYIYVVMITGIGFLTTGAVVGLSTAVNFAVYDDYPIDQYLNPCNNVPRAIEEETKELTEQERESCNEETEMLRKEQIVNDLTQTFSSILVGSVLFIPHLVWSRKL